MIKQDQGCEMPKSSRFPPLLRVLQSEGPLGCTSVQPHTPPLGQPAEKRLKSLP